MMLKEIKRKLDDASPDYTGLFFITRKKRREEIEYSVLRTEITADIGEALITIVKQQLSKLLETVDLEYIEYNPAINLDKNHVETIKREEVHYLDEILQDMNSADLNIFDMKQSKNLWAYAIKIGNSGITLFRKYTEKRILDIKGWIPLFVQNGVFNKLTDSILTIDKDIDCIYYDGKVFILDKIQFEKIFSFMDKFILEIDANICHLEEKSLVDDITALQELCKSDPRKIKKLNKVLKSDILNSLNTKRISEINRQYNLDLDFTEDGKIIVSHKNIWTVLRVLDDEYLESSMTDNKYEVHSKVRAA
jgi:DNA gyrase/topoisomerase IV subunit A